MVSSAGLRSALQRRNPAEFIEHSSLNFFIGGACDLNKDIHGHLLLLRLTVNLLHPV